MATHLGPNCIAMHREKPKIRPPLRGSTVILCSQKALLAEILAIWHASNEWFMVISLAITMCTD